MLGCAFVVTVAAVVADVVVPALTAYVALATVPVTLAPVIELKAAPLPLKLMPSTLPVVDKLVNTPTLVMLGCAFVVTVPAVVAAPALTAYVALATVPVTLAPASADRAKPLPITYAPCTFAVVIMLAVFVPLAK